MTNYNGRQGVAMNPILSRIEARAASGAWHSRFMSFLITAALYAFVLSLGRLAWLVVTA